MAVYLQKRSYNLHSILLRGGRSVGIVHSRTQATEFSFSSVLTLFSTSQCWYLNCSHCHLYWRQTHHITSVASSLGRTSRIHYEWNKQDLTLYPTQDNENTEKSEELIHELECDSNSRLSLLKVKTLYHCNRNVIFTCSWLAFQSFRSMVCSCLCDQFSVILTTKT
jgi:hypothetical protein